MNIETIKRRQAERESWEMDALLRAVAPAVRERRMAAEESARRRAKKNRINRALSRAGIPLRVI